MKLRKVFYEGPSGQPCPIGQFRTGLIVENIAWQLKGIVCLDHDLFQW